ncbi:MAG: hypothetical protein II841_00745 [Bacteroidales bacterium]|nr:hypothetical protein [Bacteroidales bacterium]
MDAARGSLLRQGTPLDPSRVPVSDWVPGFAAQPFNRPRDQGLRPWTSRRYEVLAGSPAPPPGHPSSSNQRDVSLWKPETER